LRADRQKNMVPTNGCGIAEMSRVCFTRTARIGRAMVVTVRQRNCLPRWCREEEWGWGDESVVEEADGGETALEPSLNGAGPGTAIHARRGRT